MRHDRDAILARVDLEALADELLGPRTRPAIRMWPCPKPDHHQTGRTPPLSVFTGRNGCQRWHCHGCGDGGTAIDLLLATRHATDVRDALDWLAHRAGLTPEPAPAGRPRALQAAPIAPRPPSVPPALDARTIEQLDAYASACAEHLHSRAGREARAWLTEQRAIPSEVIEAAGLGADPGPRRLPRPDGVPRVFPAVVFPVRQHGHVVYTVSRHLRPVASRWWNTAERVAPNPRLAFYDAPRRTASGIVVTEGPIDALSALAAGYQTAAILGAGTITPAIADRLAATGERLLQGSVRMDALGMLFAGALEGGAEWLPVLLLAGVLLVSVALSGGVLAWLIARHWTALVMGTLAFAVVAWWTRVRFGVDGKTALLTGWMGSASVALVLVVVVRLAVREPGPLHRARRVRSMLLITAVAGVSVVLAGLVRSGVAHQTAEDATRSTRPTAEQLGQALADSDAHTANDLALLAAHSGPGRQVVREEGDRDAEGTVLVVRISWSVPAQNEASWCWRYQLRNCPDDHLPASVGCPDAPPAVNVTPTLGQYNDGLYNALLHRPPESSGDLDAIRGAAADLVDFYIASSGTEIEVDRVGDGLVGVAVRVGLTDCVITLIDTADHETAIETWLPDPALLRSDQPGCVPVLARSSPDAAAPQGL